MRERVDLKSPVREYRPPGSVRGAPGNRCPYLDERRKQKWKKGYAQLSGFLLSQFLLSALPSALARGLRPFGVTSRVLRIGTQCAKGYDLADFTEAFSRFL